MYGPPLHRKFSLTFLCLVLYLTTYKTMFRSAGACSRFFFSRRPFALCKPKTTQIVPFKISHLRNANFASSLLSHSCKMMGVGGSVPFSLQITQPDRVAQQFS